MTSRWGPLGWATLHSVALLYPDHPSQLEIELLRRWLNSFNDTIVCPSCMEHFRTMRTKYEREHPTMLSSRKEFCTFVMRAHNTVNRRTKKKVYTIEESIAELQRILPGALAQQRRRDYLHYIRKQWSLDRGLSGITALGKLRDLQLTEMQYWEQKGAPNWDSLASYVESVDPLNEMNVESNPVLRTLSNAMPMPTFSLFRKARARAALNQSGQS
jgi:hypothetical protein